MWYIIWGTVKADIFVTRAIKPCNESSLVIKFSAFAARTSVYACDYIFKLNDRFHMLPNPYHAIENISAGCITFHYK